MIQIKNQYQICVNKILYMKIINTEIFRTVRKFKIFLYWLFWLVAWENLAKTIELH